MSDLRMPEARCADSGEIVQPTAKNLRPGHVAYGAWHKGRLRCAFCDASVHYNAGSPVIAGGHHGRQAHFVTDPGSAHDGRCLLPPAKDAHRAEIDRAKGYRIHINTLDYSDQFNLAAGPYERDEDGRLKLKDPSLKAMETVAVRQVEDIARLIRRGDFERLNKSVVMLADRAEPLPWEQFLIRYNRKGGGQPRFEGLADRILCKEFLPAAVEIVAGGARGNRVESRPVPAGFLHGRTLTVVPQVWLNNRDDTRVMGCMDRPGRYLVLGVPTLSRPVEYRDGGLARYLNIGVTDIRQVMCADLSALAAEGRRKGKRRSAGPALAAE
jgi:hypothetical protein